MILGKARRGGKTIRFGRDPVEVGEVDTGDSRCCHLPCVDLAGHVSLEQMREGVL